MSAVSAANDEEQLAFSIVARLSQLEKDMARANGITAKAFREMTLSSTKATKQMEDDAIRLAAKVNQALASISPSVGAYGRTSEALAKTAANANTATRSLNSLSGQTGNIAAQFQDIAVQLQGGGSPFTIALQQGTQLGAVLGTAGGLGAAVKGVGAAFVSMLSPVNLITIGLIAAGGAAVKYFMQADQATALTDALKQQPEIIKAIRAAWGDAAAGAAGYASESSAVIAAMVAKQKETLAAGAASASAQAFGEISRFVDAGKATSGIARMASTIADQNRAPIAGLEQLKAAAEALKSAETDPRGLIAARNALAEIATNDAFDKRIRDFAKDLLDTTKEAGTAANALIGLDAAQVRASGSVKALVSETKTFNSLLADGKFNEAAKHAQTLGQALEAAAAAQKHLNEEANRFASERLANAGAGYEALNDYYARRNAGLPTGDVPSGANGLLDLIGNTEGTDRRRGYNETLGYGKFTGGDVSLTTMTLDQIMALQSKMLADPSNTFNSSALGRYQITKTTLQDLMGQLGLKGTELFDPAMQDRLANELIRQSGGKPSALRGRWTSLQNVPDATISQAYGKTSLSLGNMDTGLKSQQDAYQAILKSGQEFIESQNAQASEVGKTGRELARMRAEQELLNEAQKANINLTPEQRQAISDLAVSMGNAAVKADEMQKASDRMNQLSTGFADASKGAVKGFVSDLISGKSAAEALSNALINLGQRLADLALDSIFSGGGSSGGLFGSLFGSLFGGMSGPLNLGSFLTPSAKGNVFNSPGLHAYRNAVVSRPTIFPFASGGAFGLMGEAGEEAIMPLKKDASGRLGVSAHGAVGGASVTNTMTMGDITINVPDGTDPKDAGRIGTEVSRQLKQMMQAEMKNQMRSGGMLNKGVFG